MLSFEQLCGEYGLQRPPHDRSSPRPLAPADYLSLCRALPILFISDVPMLGADQRDAARRWVSFLDVAYEAGVTLTCSSESGSVEGVFAGLLAAAGLQGQDTSLGKAQGQVKGSVVPVTSKLVQGLRAQAQAQAAAAVGIVHAPQPAALGHVDAWLEASRRSATVAPVSWLLAEEVLMYHRAASRLAEMCGPSA